MKNLNTIIIGLLVLAVLAYQSIFVVPEGQKALLTRFAKVVRNGDGAVSLYEPGAGLKIPFVDKVMYLDARVQTLNSTADRFVTSEKKDLIIDSYVKWKITDFEKFYTANQGSFLIAEDRLRDKITTSLRSQIALLNIREIVAGKSSNEEEQTESGGSSKREQIMQNTLTITGPGAEKDLGIKIVDVRIMKFQARFPVQYISVCVPNVRLWPDCTDPRGVRKLKPSGQRLTDLRWLRLPKPNVRPKSFAVPVMPQPPKSTPMHTQEILNSLIS